MLIFAEMLRQYTITNGPIVLSVIRPRLMNRELGSGLRCREKPAWSQFQEDVNLLRLVVLSGRVLVVNDYVFNNGRVIPNTRPEE